MGQKYNYYRLLMGWRVIEPWSKFRSGSEIRRGRSATLAGIVLEIEGNDVPSKELACTERRITSMSFLFSLSLINEVPCFFFKRESNH